MIWYSVCFALWIESDYYSVNVMLPIFFLGCRKSCQIFYLLLVIFKYLFYYENTLGSYLSMCYKNSISWEFKTRGELFWKFWSNNDSLGKILNIWKNKFARRCDSFI